MDEFADIFVEVIRQTIHPKNAFAEEEEILLSAGFDQSQQPSIGVCRTRLSWLLPGIVDDFLT